MVAAFQRVRVIFEQLIYLRILILSTQFADIDVKEEIRKPSIYSIQARDFSENIPRASVYSMYSNSLDNETLKAKARQSITVHNHDFEIVTAMKRRSTMLRNVLDVEAKKESYAKTASIGDITINGELVDEAIEKAENGIM